MDIRLKTVFYVLPAIVIENPDWVADRFKAQTRMFVVFTKTLTDKGLLEHELEHVRQFYMTLGLHGLLYLFVEKYRLWSEVRAYKVQLHHSPGNLQRYAGYIADKYGLGVNKTQAKRMLKE